MTGATAFPVHAPGLPAVPVMVLFMAFLWTGCGTGDPDLFLYVSLQEEDRVAAFRIDPPTGGLQEAGSLDVEGSPACLALHPANRFMYVAQRSGRAISSLRINQSTGQLERLNTIPSHNPVYLAADRSGRYLLAAFNEPQPDLGDDRMKAVIYRIQWDGSLREGAVQEIITGLKPHSITTDPTNRFLYIPCTNAEYVMQFRFDPAAGTATPLQPPVQETPAGTGPRHFEFHGSMNVIYFVNETSGSVTGYRIGKEGALEPFQTISTLPEGFAGSVISADIHLTPDNRFLYASNRRDENSIAGYQVDPATAKLERIGIWPTERMPREFDIDPTGHYLYAAGEASGNLAIYRIDRRNGELEPPEVLPVGERPTWVLAVDLSGNP